MPDVDRSPLSFTISGIVMILVAGATLLTALALDNATLAVVFYAATAGLVIYGVISIGRGIATRRSR